MIFRVGLSKHAAADLEELPEKICNQVIKDIRTLQTHPFPHGRRIRKLRGFKDALFRLRAGDYRVVFQRQGQDIFIIRVLSKKDFSKIYG